MADKTPVRVVFNSSNVATGMAEFQSGETVPVANGGTGLGAIGSAGQIIKVNAAGNALEFGAEGDISITNLVAPTNADLTLTTSGTGGIILNDISISDNAISTNRTNDDFKINASGTGTVNLENLKVGTGGATVTTILDEDAMGSDSATSLATQQSIKAYVDAQDAAIASDTLTLTNKTFDAEGTGNSLSNVDVANLKSGVLDTDISSVAETDTTLASAKAIKAYADTKAVLSGSTNNQITTVTGAHAIQGESNLTFDGSTLAVTGAVTVSGDLAVDTNTLFVDVSTNRVGVGSTTLSQPFTIHDTSSAQIHLRTANPAIRFSSDEAGGSDSTRAFIGLATNSNAFINGTAAGDLAIRSATDGKILLGHSGGEYARLTTSGATFTAGVTATTGTFSGNVAISGDLTVSGDTTTVSTTNTAISDNILELNTGISQSFNDAGIIIERGSTGNNAAIIWDESADTFVLGTTTATAGDKSGGITIDAGSLKIASLEVDGVTITDNTIGANASNSSLELEASGTGDIDLNAGADVNIPANIGLTFGDDGEKIEGNGTLLTISSSNNIVFDANNDILLDSGTGAWYFNDDGSTIGSFTNSSSDFVLKSNVSDKDLIFKGNDGGSTITALTLDMSAAGTATFNHDVILPNDGILQFGDAGENIVGDGTNLTISSSGKTIIDSTGDIELDAASGVIDFIGSGTVFGNVAVATNDLVIKSRISDGDMSFRGNDGGAEVTALSLDMSAAGAATFNAGVTATTGTFSGNVAISGDLTVSGDTATVSTTNTTIADNIIELNTGISQSSNDAGIIIERGSTGNNAAIIWDESADTFVLGTTTATAADKSGGITIDAGSLKVASLEADGVTITDNVITSNSSNADLEINANGSGSVVIGQVSTNSVTGEVIPGKVGGTNFTDSLLVGHATTGTLSSAVENTGVGIEALQSITSGSKNTVIGNESGKAMTNAQKNVFMGYRAGYQITGSNFNVGIGSEALSASDGSTASNTAIGALALSQVSGGNYNIGIGRASGDNITTGDGNVIIGNVDADSTTGDRQLKIAGNDFTTTTTWITGDSSGNLTTVGDVTLANNKKVIFGDAGESISGDGTNLYIVSSNALGFDVANGITLDSGSGGTILKAGGSTTYGTLTSSSGNLSINQTTSDKDIIFTGNDGGSTITALTLDMSAAGAATFNDKIVMGANKEIEFVDTNESIKSDGSKMIIKSGGTTFNLPTADGTAGQALVTDGSGTLSFDSVATTVSDDGLATVKSNKHLGSTARTLDSINATFIDSAFYFFVLNDIVNETISAEMFAVTNNDTASFLGNRRGIESSGGGNVPTLATDVSNGQYRVRVTGTSADCRGSFYKVAMSSSTTDATRGNTVTSSNTDVDSASESVDTFAHATFRGAKYFISVDNDSKTEMEVVEALVVHDGTNAFISQYGHTTSGNNSLVTLTAAISGDNVVVSAAGLETNLNLTMHKILLKDNMTAQSNANQKAFAAVTVSSSATAIDLMDIDEANGAVHFIVGANASEGAYSIQEVYTAATPGVPAVANGPFVSTKGTSQLDFTAAFDTSSENSLELFASSTSGGSTTVSGYRISVLAG